MYHLRLLCGTLVGCGTRGTILTNDVPLQGQGEGRRLSAKQDSEFRTTIGMLGLGSGDDVKASVGGGAGVGPQSESESDPESESRGGRFVNMSWAPYLSEGGATGGGPGVGEQGGGTPSGYGDGAGRVYKGPLEQVIILVLFVAQQRTGPRSYSYDVPLAPFMWHTCGMWYLWHYIDQ